MKVRIGVKKVLGVGQVQMICSPTFICFPNQKYMRGGYQNDTLAEIQRDLENVLKRHFRVFHNFEGPSTYRVRHKKEMCAEGRI